MTEHAWFKRVAAWLSVSRNLIGLALGLTVATPLVWTWGAGLPDAVRAVLLSAMIAVLGGLVGATFAVIVLRSRDAPLGYRWLKLEQTREFHRDNPRVQRLLSRITIEARRDNVEVFADISQWTGAVPPRRTVLSEGHSLLPVLARGIEGWERYYVHLGRPLMRHETAQIVLQSEYADVSDDRLHWISKTVREPIYKELKVVLRMGPFTPSADSFSAEVKRPADVVRTVRRLKPNRDVSTGDTWIKVRRPKSGLRYHLDVAWTYPAELPDPLTADLSWEPPLA